MSGKLLNDCRRPSSVLAAAAIAGLLLAAGSAGADEDAKKLADRKPMVPGPIVKGAAARRMATGRTDDVFPNKNVTLLSWLPLNNFGDGSESGADCWGYVSPSGREYAIIGLERSIGYVEITDPGNPVMVAVIPGPVSLWKDISVIGPWAYCVSEGGAGIQVHDLRNIDAGIVTKVQDKTQGGHSSTHTIVYNPDSKWLYLCGTNINNGGLTPVNTTDPSNPTFGPAAWKFRYVHEAQVRTMTTGPFAGREIAFLFTGGPAIGYSVDGGVDIVDVTDKANLVTISSSATPPVAFRYPGLAFCHQGWVDSTEKYLYIDDEIDGPSVGVLPTFTRIIDITDLRAPKSMGGFTSSQSSSVDHNLYFKDRYVFGANYTSGLHVFDATDRLKPEEIAFLDTRPEDDGATYNGAWGNYPFFPSGTVIISDLERGLFVVKVALGRLVLTYPTPIAATVPPGVATPITVQIEERDLTLDPASVKFYQSVGGGPFTASMMTPGAPGLFSSSLAPADCFKQLRYYVEAKATDGRTFTWPEGAPTVFSTASVQTGFVTAFADDFESDKGWTVASTALTGGAWTRQDPNGTTLGGRQANPEDDATPPPGIRCWFTGQGTPGGSAGAADVDGGPTRLTSPVIDLAGLPRADLAYSRWFFNDDGDDFLDVEVSNDNGSTWKLIEHLGSTNIGWVPITVNIGDYVPLTSQMRLRFSTADNPNNSTTEAAVDDIVITVPTCTSPCYADCDGNGKLDVSDFTCYQNKFALGEAYADCSGDSKFDVQDFTCFQNKFALGCP